MGNIPIESIDAKEIRDSRNKPTVSVTVHAGGKSGTFLVPSGASTGSHEALELRDDDGKGVTQALQGIEQEIAPALKGMNVADQRAIDEKMCTLDGTPNKSRLGANALIGVSIACAKAAAAAQGQPVYAYLRTLAEMMPSASMPRLFMNLVNGGKHATTNLAFQEYHLIPKTESAIKAVAMSIAVQKRLGELIRAKYNLDDLSLGDEGGFMFDVGSVTEPLALLVQAIQDTGNAGMADVGMDVAASSFYKDGSYVFDGASHDAAALAALYGDLIQQYGLFSVEDPFFEEGFQDFAALQKEYPGLLIIGDDLTVTNKTLLEKAIEGKSISGIIIKPNQIGTLTETLETMQLAREHNIHCIISHRSGETMDDTIADIAFAFGAYGLKAGAPEKPERAVKYRRLEEIEKKQ